MSGTSMDAIDGVLVQLKLDENEKLDFKVLDLHSQVYPESLKKQLLEIIQNKPLNIETLCQVNFDVAKCFANVANTLIQNNSQIKVDAIASHGQTIWHIPPGGNQTGSTLQIGPGSVISALTKTQVISDFRTGDMALGGQGAPLVPFADKLLFQQTDHPIAIQNLGGIANVTIVPAKNSKLPLIAFDTGPANALMDMIAERFLKQPADFDAKLASQGQVVEPLLIEWLNDPYFSQLPPKSTGKEKFNWAFIEAGLKELNLKAICPEDLMRTALALTEESIFKAYQDFVLPDYPIQQIVLGGGGTQNPLLLQSLNQRFNPLGIELKTHEDVGIPNQYKEAFAFAILGYARLLDIPTNIATGAQRLRSLGCISY
jgi:anhydro-N-acetylmuramic acid kinase